MKNPRVDLQALLESERGIPAVPAEVRTRAVSRARRAVVKGQFTTPIALRPAPLRWALAAMGVLVLGALATAAVEWRRRPPRAEGDVIEPSAPPAPSRIAAPEPDLTSIEVRPSPAAAPPRHRPLTQAEAYAQELRFLRPAREAIAREDFVAALAATAAHARRFPRGRLAEEREAIRIVALAGGGRPSEARLAAAAFHAHFTNSLLKKRVDEAVGGLP